MINILIVEDDKNLRKSLVEIVAKLGFSVSDEVKSSTEAVRSIECKNPDLILLDINIKGKASGSDFAKNIEGLKIPIIFLLEPSKEHRIDEFKNQEHYQFITNPPTEENVKTAIEKLPSLQGGDSTMPSYKSLIFKKRGSLHRIKIDDVLFVKAADDYTITITNKQEYVSSCRLFEMQEKLNPFGFFKSHRSFLVNPSRIESMDTRKSKLKLGEHMVSISRSSKAEVTKLVGELLDNRK